MQLNISYKLESGFVTYLKTFEYDVYIQQKLMKYFQNIRILS